jgi:hypothetical protein
MITRRFKSARAAGHMCGHSRMMVEKSDARPEIGPGVVLV